MQIFRTPPCPFDSQGRDTLWPPSLPLIDNPLLDGRPLPRLVVHLAAWNSGNGQRAPFLYAFFIIIKPELKVPRAPSVREEYDPEGPSTPKSRRGVCPVFTLSPKG